LAIPFDVFLGSIRQTHLNQLHGLPSADNSLINDHASFSPRTVDVNNQSDSDFSLVHTKGWLYLET